MNCLKQYNSIITSNKLSPSVHKFCYEFTHSGLSVVRHAHHPEFFEGLSESRLYREKALFRSYMSLYLRIEALSN